MILALYICISAEG